MVHTSVVCLSKWGGAQWYIHQSLLTCLFIQMGWSTVVHTSESCLSMVVRVSTLSFSPSGLHLVIAAEKLTLNELSDVTC